MHKGDIMKSSNKEAVFNFVNRHRNIILLVALAFAVRLIAFVNSDNVWGGDPSEKIRLTYNWLFASKGYNRLLPSSLWLPLHF